MDIALALAARGRHTVRPNPMVGCVISAQRRVVGEGFHERPGRPHAEVVALRAAGAAARGADVHVTLEPCAHVGRTPPCTDALIAAGVARVVYAMDEVHRAATGGADVLRAHGIEVVGGVRAAEARALNEVFVHVQEVGRPFVTVKIAQTLDGRVAARDGSSRWITSAAARRQVHELRALSDGVAVGAGTVVADDPDLSVRHVDALGGQPRPVVLDASGRTPLTARVVRPGAIVLTTAASPAAWREGLSAAGVEVVAVDGVGDGDEPRVDLRVACVALLERDVQALLVEAGPTLTATLVREQLVDRLVVHIAPALMGGDGAPSVAALGVASVTDLRRWHIERVGQLGDDLEVVARPD
ncbi:MAG: bifunctional diaminohydroxyphosphoribosylaminopyrimidine deaminase/5-amino-6-(5-phosphoribosylamino)uracil reductase RibD [Actinobacteria bacterium]|nr:bifunctional diaminohydroxyphosphoribosylaminopyrimidine deaminase/5-amino-6-(5-phosphoribosylamino)uracil reductase RibD [Actinomycetota bacterium]